MLNNYIKTLVLSTIVLVVNNNCYSMNVEEEIDTSSNQNNNIINEQQVNINQNQRILYADHAAPTIAQMIKCANYEPIDVNSPNSEYKKFIDFCKEKDIPGIKELVYNFLMSIYSIASCIIGDTACSDKYRLPGYIEKWDLQKEASNNPALYNDHTKYKEYFVNRKQLLENNKIYVQEYSDSIRIITQIMNDVHKKLNPSKITLNIDANINGINNHIMNIFYYFANHLVELSHDILYAIDKKISEYKVNPTLYDFNKFRYYIEHKVIIPSYHTIARFYNEVFINYINVNNILCKNKTIHHELSYFLYYINELFFHFELEDFYDLERCVLYGTRLCQEKYEKLKIIAGKLDKIIKKFESTKSYIIKAHIKYLDEIKHDYLNHVMYYGIEVRDINNLENAQIIQNVNNSIKEYTFQYIRNKNKIINNIFKQEEICLYDEREILTSYFFYLGKNYLPKIELEKLFYSEKEIFSEEIQKFNDEIHKLDDELDKMNYNMITINPNDNYSAEMRYSLAEYTKYNTKGEYFHNN